MAFPSVFIDKFDSYLSALSGNLALFSLVISILIFLSVIIIGFVINSIERGIIMLLCMFVGSRLSHFSVVYLTFPGTVFHELSHALLGILTGAKVTEIVFVEPPSTGRLGHVSFIVRGSPIQKAFQYSLISSAPVLLGCLMLYLLYIAMGMFSYSSIKIVIIYVATSILCHMSMSPQDIRNYLKGFFLTFPLIYVIVLSFLYIKSL